MQKQSFEVAQVTDDRPDVTYTDEGRSAAGKGAAYGTVIHRIFDDAINMRLPADPTPYVAHLLNNAGADAGFLPTRIGRIAALSQLGDMGEKYRHQKPYIPKSPSRYRRRRTTPAKLSAASSTWSIACPKDGKSSITKPIRSKPTKMYEALCEQTADQVNTYARHWEKFTGETIFAKGLWLTERCEFRGV